MLVDIISDFISRKFQIISETTNIRDWFLFFLSYLDELRASLAIAILMVIILEVVAKNILKNFDVIFLSQKRNKGLRYGFLKHHLFHGVFRILIKNKKTTLLQKNFGNFVLI